MAKNKLAPPFRVATFDITYGIGISKVGEIIDLGVEHDIVGKSGAWYSYGGSKIAQGREAAKRFLADNPEVADEIEAKIKEILLGIPVDGGKPKTDADDNNGKEKSKSKSKGK